MSSPSNEEISNEIQAWINLQTSESLSTASVKTIRKELRVKFSMGEKFTKEQKDFIQATTIPFLQTRLKELEEAKELKEALFSSEEESDNEDEVSIAQVMESAKKKKNTPKKKSPSKKKKNAVAVEKDEEEEEEEEEEESEFEGDEEEDSDEESVPPTTKRLKTKQSTTKDNSFDEEIEIVVDKTHYDEETPDIFFGETELVENVEMYRETANDAPWSVTLHHPDFNKYVRLQLISHKKSSKMWLLTREGMVKSAHPKINISAIPKRRGVSKFQDMFKTKTGKEWTPVPEEVAEEDEQDSSSNSNSSNSSKSKRNKQLYVRVVDETRLSSILRKPDIKKRKRTYSKKTSSSSPSPNKRSRTGENAVIFSEDSNSSESSDTSSDESSSDEEEETTLDARIVLLLKTTSDTKAISLLLAEKNCSHPIKKLTRATINRGFETLRDLEKVIKFQEDDNSDDEGDKNETLVAFSETFYKIIRHDYDIDPQVCSVMYPIDSLEVRIFCFKEKKRFYTTKTNSLPPSPFPICIQLLNERVQLLESLCVIEHGLRTSKIKRARRVKKLNLNDRYASLRYQLVPHQVSSTSILDTALSSNEDVLNIQKLFKECASISNNISSSSSSTSSRPITNDVRLEPSLIYTVHCEADDARFEPFDRLPSQHQLWYGIRKCELGGVLSHGIPFPSAEAPASSYPYGKCLQFSTSPIVAAKRCFEFEPLVNDDDDDDDNTIILGLCTVACGNTHSITEPNIFYRPPAPCHSVKLDHVMGQDVFIYDLGQIHLESIVFVKATKIRRTTKKRETASDLVNEIMVREQMNEVTEHVEMNLGNEGITNHPDELAVELKAVELQEQQDVRPPSTDMNGDTTSSSSLDFANEILAEAAKSSSAAAVAAREKTLAMP